MRRTNAEVFQWYRSRVHSDIARFQRYLVRVESMMGSGSFWELAEATRRAIREMLNRLYRRLSELQRRLVLKLAAGLLAFGLLGGMAAAEVTFQEQTGSANPFFEMALLEREINPTFADMDDDGDMDAVIGTKYAYGGPEAGELLYCQNLGPTQPGTFEFKIGAEDPFDGLMAFMNIAASADPELVNIDGDSDLDLFVGGHYEGAGYSGSVSHFTRNAGLFTQQLDTANPLSQIWW